MRWVQQNVGMMQQADVSRLFKSGQEMNSGGNVRNAGFKALPKARRMMPEFIARQDYHSTRIPAQNTTQQVVEIDVHLSELLCTDIPMRVGWHSKSIATAQQRWQLCS